MSFLTSKRRKESLTLSDEECERRVGQCYLENFPWKEVVSTQLATWIKLVAGARKCRPEFLLVSVLPTISAICGPTTKVVIAEQFHEERLNLYLCILGESGANKSGAFGLGCSILKEMEEAEKIIVDNNWSRNGLLTHLASQDGHCLLAYEEMDAFFATVVKGESQGTSDRTFFCELYDGRARTITRSSNDSKTVLRTMVPETCMNIIGFHQPEPFLKDYYDMCLRKDGFLDRFLFCCPNSLRIGQDEVEVSRRELYSYTERMLDLKELYSSLSTIKHSQMKLRFSPEARALYNGLASDENEDYNMSIQRKMSLAKKESTSDGSDTNQMETKFVRTVIKLAGCLHMLEEAFAHIMATEATVDSGAVGGEQPKSDVGDEQPKSDEAKLTNSSLVPSTVITTETLRRAKALGRYFSGQRDILFRADKDATGASQNNLKEDESVALAVRVLTSKGKFTTATIVRSGCHRTLRPETAKVLETFRKLQQEEFGELHEVGRVTAFLKNPHPLNLERYSLKMDEYSERFKMVIPFNYMVETTQLAVSNKHTIIYPNMDEKEEEKEGSSSPEDQGSVVKAEPKKNGF